MSYGKIDTDSSGNLRMTFTTSSNESFHRADGPIDDATFKPQALIFGPILIILIIAGIVGNVITIVTILYIRRLRTLPNYLSINLAISDLVTAACVNSMLLHNVLTNTHLQLNTLACDITGYASSITPITSLMILSTMSFQRYAASSRNPRLKALNKSKLKVGFDLALPWVMSSILDVVFNKVMNEGHIWDKKIHMCIYVHTDWRVSTIHFVLLVGCTLMIFTSHWQLSRATYRWPSVRTPSFPANGKGKFTVQEKKEMDRQRGSFYISVAGKTVSLQSYQAFKVRSSLRRTLILVLIFIFTCFPWYTLAMINSIIPLDDRAPSIVWLTAAVLEHANCSLNFFVNSALSHRYRKLVARHMPLPPVIAQRLIRATHSRPLIKTHQGGPTSPLCNGNSKSSPGVFFRSNIDTTSTEAEMAALQEKVHHQSTASLPLAATEWSQQSKASFKKNIRECRCEVFEEEDGTIYLHI